MREDFVTSAAEAALILRHSGIAEAMPLRNFAEIVNFRSLPSRAPHGEMDFSILKIECILGSLWHG
jgi:hypothetical protein